MTKETETHEANLNREVIAFKPNEIEAFGNRVINFILQHDADKAEAEARLAQASNRENFIDFELTRVALHLHNEEKIDLYLLYSDNKNDASRLYRSILMETGAVKRIIDEKTDNITYEFTDPAIRDKFYFDDELKKEDEQEFIALFANVDNFK